jgi:hypothetical protein
MSLNALRDAAKNQHLAVLGALHAEPGDNLGAGTIALLGPAEPGFWPTVSQTPEFADGKPNPLDRWSARVITDIADTLGGMALFPFGDPPRPFIGWALRSGQAFVSPASLLVHKDAGLFVSYRGAVLLPKVFALPAPAPNPCESCATKPCLTACPPQALTVAGYDLPACHKFLDTKDGTGCMTQGCAVRRSCPLSQSYPRIDAQSAFHMKAFHPCPSL